MAQVGLIYYRVPDQETGGYISTSGIDIYTDILPLILATRITKVGILAPPGTKVVLNDESKSIIIGRTGIYELDDDIAITKMYFVRLAKYKLDEEKTNAARETGYEGILAADAARNEAMESLSTPIKDKNDPNYSAYWAQYEQVQSDYIDAYEKALSLFSAGNNGIYTLPNEEEINAPENYLDLHYIIVDYIYEA